MMTLRPRRLLPLALAAMVLGGLLLAAAPAHAVDLAGAEQDLEQLKKATKPRATNEDLLQYLDAVFTNFKDLKGPEKPADDASEEEKKAWEKANDKFEKGLEKYRGNAEKLILKIMTLVKVKNETNVRDDVNIRAANILGDMAPLLDEKGRKDLSKKVMAAIDKRLTKVKTHEVNSDLLAAAFGALGKLNHESSLEWMLKNHCHANEVQKQYIIAAHKAMVLYKDIDGKLRYEVCAQFVKVYGSVEAQAEKSSTDAKDLAKKRFWDDIKTYTIPVVQHFAGKPTDKDGNALATMADFFQFMRDHKNMRKEPWADPKVEK